METLENYIKRQKLNAYNQFKFSICKHLDWHLITLTCINNPYTFILLLKIEKQREE